MARRVHTLEMDDDELRRLLRALVGFGHTPRGSIVRCQYCQRQATTLDAMRHVDGCAFPTIEGLARAAGLLDEFGLTRFD